MHTVQPVLKLVQTLSLKLSKKSYFVRQLEWQNSVLRIWDPGSGAFLTPGSGMGKNQDPDPG